MSEVNAVLTVEVLERLPEREAKRLDELEAVIKADLAAFIRVGKALAEILHSRLYRGEFVTFESYVAAKWDMGRAHAARLIDAHTVVEQLEHTLPGTCGFTSPIGDILPSSESQVRPLTKYKDDPEMLAKVWDAAIRTAPQGKVTAKHVQRTVCEVTGQQIEKKMGETKKRVRQASQDGQVSPEFTAAFEALLHEVEQARNGGYKTSSREGMVRHLDALRHLLSEDGSQIVDPID